jgi:hypothetical protein
MPMRRKAVWIGAACSVAGLVWWLYPKTSLQLLSKLPVTEVPYWDGVHIGDWDGDKCADLFTVVRYEHFYVFNGNGQVIGDWSPPNLSNVDLGLGAVMDVDGDGRAEPFLSWSEGPALKLAVLNQRRYPIKIFETKGRSVPDKRAVRNRYGNIIPKAVVRAYKGSSTNRLLLAFLSIGYGGSPRGLCCFDYETQERLWTYLTGPEPQDLEILETKGQRFYVFSGGSPGNGNVGEDGSDDAHAAVFAVSSEGKAIWRRELGGKYLTAHVIALDLDGDGQKQILCWVQGGGVHGDKEKTEGFGLVAEIDFSGNVVPSYHAGEMLMSCLAADLDGDGKVEILCTDGAGQVHVLNSDLSLRRKFTLVPRTADRVELIIVGLARFSQRQQPRLVIRSSQYFKDPAEDDYVGYPDDPLNRSIRNGNFIGVLDLNLQLLASYGFGTNWTVDRHWEVRLADMDGDGWDEILSLLDHDVAVLKLKRTGIAAW